MAQIPLSAVASEDIKEGAFLIVENDSAKYYRYGTEGYADSVAMTDANKGERVIYEKRMRIKFVSTQSPMQSDDNPDSLPSNVIDLGTTLHDLDPDIYE